MNNTATNEPVVWRKGKKTFLRPLEVADAPIIYRGINDDETTRFLNTNGPIGLGFEEEWIKNHQKPSQKQVVVAICIHDGTLIGTMGLHNINYIDGTAVTGTAIYREEHRNQGYGTDAKMLLLQFAFMRLNLHLVESRVLSFNDRSAKYTDKCGYIEEARLRDRINRFGQRYDEIILSVTKKEWLPLWKKYQSEETEA